MRHLHFVELIEILSYERNRTYLPMHFDNFIIHPRIRRLIDITWYWTFYLSWLTIKCQNDFPRGNCQHMLGLSMQLSEWLSTSVNIASLFSSSIGKCRNGLYRSYLLSSDTPFHLVKYLLQAYFPCLNLTDHYRTFLIVQRLLMILQMYYH